MKILFLGDSITAGVGASAPEYKYVELVKNSLDCEVQNYGVSGTRIAPQKTPSPQPSFDETFLMRAKKMDKDADMVFVFGGTNDYGHGDAEIGNFEEKNPDTFIGAFYELIAYLVGVYGKNKLHFIMPLPRYNQENLYGEGFKKNPSATLNDYIEIEKKILEESGIPYIDFSDTFPVPQTNTGDAWTVDGLHPSDAGHSILAAKICLHITFQANK